MTNEYLEKIRNGDVETIRSLYQGNEFLGLKKYVFENGGSNVDVQEIFADALVILIKKLQDEDFVLTSTLEKYIFGIGKNLWRVKNRKKKLSQIDITKIEEESHNNLHILGDELIEKEQEEILSRVLSESLKEINENCQGILRMYYYEKKDMASIAEELGYKNASTVRKVTHRCRQKLRVLLNEKLGEYYDNPNDAINK